MEETKDSRLRGMGSFISELATKAMAVNTMKMYNQGLRAWKQWAGRFPEANTIPIKPLHLAAFFASVVQQHGKFGKIEQAFYGLNWLHKVLNVPNPCESTLVRHVKDASKRILKNRVVKKCPIRPHHLRRLVSKFGRSRNLLHLRVVAIALVSYAGFLRYDEVSQIRRNHIQFEATYFNLFIPSSKTDQEADGETVHIAYTGHATCPGKALRRYLRSAQVKDDDSRYIFRPATRTKDGHKLKDAIKPIAYTTTRDTVMAAVQDIGLNRKLFGLHSFRRGGASEAARRGVPDRLFKKHGRWKSENAKDGYVSEDTETRLTVSRNLGI